jgi:antitoxin component YwqK of YwqJK toxin-antitoxin module
MKALINHYESQGMLPEVWEDYWLDGTLRKRVHYHKRKKHGTWEEYFINGQLEYRDRWNHGRRQGLAVEYNRSGTSVFKSFHLNIK